MSQQVRKRKQATVQYVSNGKQTETLSRGYIYRELYLRLRSTPTIAGASNTVANTRDGDDWGVVKRIDIRANGTNVIRSYSGNDLKWLNYFWYGIQPRITPTLGDGATANPALDSTLIIPFWQPRTLRPMDTALDSRVLSSLEIEIEWGTFTDINSAASAWTSQPTLDIYSTEVFGVTGPFSQWRQWPIEKDISASNQRFQVDIPVSNMYRNFLIRTYDTNGDNAAILNNFRLISGTTVYADLPGPLLNETEWQRRGLVRTLDQGVAVANLLTYNKVMQNARHNFGAWYYYEHVMDGYMTENIDTLGFSELKLECDVTVGGASSKIRVIPSEIVPVKRAA